MQLQSAISPVHPDDFPRVVQVWEASVRATHHFVSEADIEIFRPLLRDGLPQIAQLACVRDGDDQVAGYVAVAHGKVDALFIHPAAQRQGAGKRLLDYAVTTFGATGLDVNEQNVQAVGFYRHMGFEIAGRSELDGTGKPYPLPHLRRSGLAADVSDCAVNMS
jgi:putative acetyltransferase